MKESQLCGLRRLPQSLCYLGPAAQGRHRFPTGFPPKADTDDLKRREGTWNKIEASQIPKLERRPYRIKNEDP
ncbi:hypothetical protein NDU88_004360 [Pleurodeles waltl]|uniref:Uncharacterized protein n=1 Tax=Pleurodeles waltl TaxID=8319 RepID=A0AAV7SIL6_PLEWA|nr:hypothetical protein NDU88_004360 [Pleurodeles waltl]